MDVIINAHQNSVPEGAKILTTQGDFWLNTLAQLGQDPCYTPYADLLRVHHQLKAGEWLIASPVHWQVTHNDAMITACGEELHLTTAIAQIWFAEISQFLAQDELTLVYHSPYCWLLDVTGKAPLKSPNLPLIKNQSLMPILAELDETMYWQRLFTELQMFLSTHPLNITRDKTTPINGLWFWGGGQLVTQSEQAMRPIMTDDLIISNAFTSGFAPDFENQSIDKKTLFAFDKPEPNLLESLEKITRQRTVSWYWNNLAYQLKPRPWYKRLFCK